MCRFGTVRSGWLMVVACWLVVLLREGRRAIKGCRVCLDLSEAKRMHTRIDERFQLNLNGNYKTERTHTCQHTWQPASHVGLALQNEHAMNASPLLLGRVASNRRHYGSESVGTPNTQHERRLGPLARQVHFRHTYRTTYTSCSRDGVTLRLLNDVKPAQFVGTLERVGVCLLNYHGLRLPFITQEKWPSGRTHAVTDILGRALLSCPMAFFTFALRVSTWYLALHG